MDEKEYRSAYDDINPLRCVFEKAINSRICNCSRAIRFNLADREGVSCQDDMAQKNCVNLLSLLRDNGRFLLQQTTIEGQLPHNAEIKIQNGGIQGLLSVVSTRATTMPSKHAVSSKHPKDTSSNTSPNEHDIAGLVTAAVQQYQSLEQLPYSNIMQAVSAFQTRRKRRKKTQ